MNSGRVRVKICGITNLEDALAAADAGADLLGFVFYPKSPRCIAPEQAAAIAAALRVRPSPPRIVGVFVNDAPERIQSILDIVPLDLIQLHGYELAGMVQSFAPRAYKAIRATDLGAARRTMHAYRKAVAAACPAFIVDAFDPIRFGGTGARADWVIAAEVAREYPVLLAGGLNADNVAEAIRVVHPWGVDVSSGVERAPGIKDPARIRDFIERVNACGHYEEGN